MLEITLEFLHHKLWTNRAIEEKVADANAHVVLRVGRQVNRAVTARGIVGRHVMSWNCVMHRRQIVYPPDWT